MRERCLKHPERTAARQVAFFLERMGKAPKKNVHCTCMRAKIDSEPGRYHYGRRLEIMEPVFANICSTHGLDYFRLRGKTQGQYRVVALLHGAQHRQDPAIWEARSPCRAIEHNGAR